MELIYNGTLVNDGTAAKGYVAIGNDGLIAEVGHGDPDGQLMLKADTATDVNGAWVMPGVIDEHVHFRDPGLTQKADIESESRAAVAGGVTSYMDMPNVVPPTVTLDRLEVKMQRAARLSRANYSFYIGATNDNIDVLRHADYSRVCGIKAFLGKSTGGMLLSDPQAMRQVFATNGPIVAIHSEDEEVINRNRARLVAEHGGAADLPLELHPAIRSTEACVASTKAAVTLARELGTRLHIMHISTAAELQLLDPSPLSDDKRITAEAVVAHLLFADSDYARLGSRIKCNPAVKTAADRDALRHAVASGLIDTIGTDHAPHLLADKQGGCLKAASGMPMVQFSLVAMLELARQGVLDVEQVVRRMCHAPADLYRIDRRGYLRKGYYADIAVVSALDTPHAISDADVVSKCGWTPLTGMLVHHRVERTYVNGRLAYSAEGGIADDVRGSGLRFNI